MGVKWLLEDGETDLSIYSVYSFCICICNISD